MKRLLLSAGIVMGGVSSLPADAQQYLGRIGGNCAVLPLSPASYSVQLAVDAPAGATLIVSVAVSSNFVSGLVASDSIGTRYQAIGGARSAAAGTVIQFRGALQRTLVSGQSLQLSFDNVGADVASCVNVQAFTGIAFGTIVQDSIGSASGSSANAAYATSSAGSPTRKLVLASLVSAADPSDTTAQPPANVLSPPLCIGTPTACLGDAYYFDDPSGPSAIDLSFTNSVDWAGTITTLLADGIFGNGFD